MRQTKYSIGYIIESSLKLTTPSTTTTPSLQHSDMAEEMRTEAMELCVTACEKFASSNEVQ